MTDIDESDDFALVLTAIQPRLYGYILKRLADREQTLEVLQRTNLVLCRKADEFEMGSNFTAWAFTIARFQVMAWRKTQQRSTLIFSDEVVELLDRSASDEAASVDERIPVLRGCLEKLRQSDRDLIRKRYRDGQPIGPIAESLARSVDAVTMQLSRVRKQLAMCVRAGLVQENSYEI